MKAYTANIQPYSIAEDSWLVELPQCNWGWLHTGQDGGRATLEADIRSTIEKLTGEKDFWVMLHAV